MESKTHQLVLLSYYTGTFPGGMLLVHLELKKYSLSMNNMEIFSIEHNNMVILIQILFKPGNKTN
jgi:hypothetical protein